MVSTVLGGMKSRELFAHLSVKHQTTCLYRRLECEACHRSIRQFARCEVEMLALLERSLMDVLQSSKQFSSKKFICNLQSGALLVRAKRPLGTIITLDQER